ncbi:LppU family putative lipoprotein [Nocardia thailandica]|uniref:LppU protein n=1 Tax=Nocardia thailandica TaxID=257275 RepID=A0ABW6PG69_9NOCA|nr:hypothetical protein [Nocardia thailandica]
MSRSLILGRMTAAAAVVLTGLAVAGCGGTIQGKAEPAIDVVPATSGAAPTKSGAPTTSGRAKPTSGKPTPTTGRGGSTDFQAEVGDCVDLGGTTTNAKIAKASCGSRSSNYKVIGKSKNSSGCVADRDATYYETLNGIETGALCLDVDWVVGGCMDVGGEDPKRIDCGQAASEAVKIVSVVENADSVDSCPAEADTGFEYPNRHFVVCAKGM